MPRIEDMARWQGVDITRFDQCITGLETTKPTKLYTEKLELSALKDKRCNHEKKVWTREDGATFEAAHKPDRTEVGTGGRQNAESLEVPGRVHGTPEQDPRGRLPQERRRQVEDGAAPQGDALRPTFGS